MLKINESQLNSVSASIYKCFSVNNWKWARADLRLYSPSVTDIKESIIRLIQTASIYDYCSTGRLAVRRDEDGDMSVSIDFSDIIATDTGWD